MNADVVVRAAFSAWRPGADLDAFFDSFHPDVEYREDPEWPGASTYRGIDAVKECFRDYADTMGFDDSQVEEVVERGDQVVAVIRVAVRPAGATEPVTQRWGYVCRVRDGKVSFFQAYVDPRKAFEAAS